MSDNKLYVGNLSFDSSEDDIREAFGAHGNVSSVNVITDRETGRPRGFAFVEMSSEDDAAKAISELNQTELEGRRLTINEARPKAPRPAQDPGFDGGRREPRW